MEEVQPLILLIQFVEEQEIHLQQHLPKEILGEVVIVEMIIDPVEVVEQQLLEHPHQMESQEDVVEQGQLQVFQEVQHLILEAEGVVNILIFQLVVQLVLVELVKLLVLLKDQDLPHLQTLVVAVEVVQVIQVQDKMEETVDQEL